MTDYLKMLEEEAFPTGMPYRYDSVLPELSTEDVVNNPKHYNTKGVECIKAIEASMSDEEFKGYLKGNCIKYIWRYNYKGNPKQDLEKAQWYLTKLIQEIGNGNF